MTPSAQKTTPDLTRSGLRRRGVVVLASALAASLLAALAVFALDSAGAAESTSSPEISTFDSCSATEGYGLGLTIDLTYLDGEPLICGRASTTTAKIAFEIRARGAKTSWSAEYSISKSAVESGSGTPVPGASGMVTVAEGAAQFIGSFSGLTPTTVYYLRVKAANEKGTTEPVVTFMTTGRPVAETESEPASDITETSAHLAGEVDAYEQETHWRFEYATPEEAVAEHWTLGPSGTIPAAPSDSSYRAVEGDLTGLTSDTSYDVRLFAENPYGRSLSTESHYGRSKIAGFETAGPPAAVTFEAHAIDREEMRALGSVNPHSFPTHYHFEYIDHEEFESGGFAKASSTPEAEGSGVVGADLPGLEPGKTYRYRIAATNTAPGNPIVYGAAQTLTVPAVPTSGAEKSCPNETLRTGASASLPDCRAYEQVTPPNKEGSTDMFTWGGGGAQFHALVGEDGEHVLLNSVFEDIGSNSAVFAGAYLFSRGGEGDWRTTSITPQPETGFDQYPLGNGGLFNADLTEVGFMGSWFTEAARSLEVMFKTGSPGGPYTTVASVPNTASSQNNGWVGASEDFHTLVLRTTDRKLLGVSTGTPANEEMRDLYEYSEGRLRQLNVDSQGRTIGACGASLVRGDQVQVEEDSGIHAISSEGSRIFFDAAPASTCPTVGGAGDEEDFGGPNRHLYMRLDGSSTVDIGEYGFLGADSEGTKLLLGKDNGGTGEVFLYDTEAQTVKHLLSVPSYVSLVNGHVSEDLSTIYFNARERLTPEAPAPGGEAEDLYRYDVASETLHFVLVTNEQSSHNNTDFNGPFMSPDGRYYYWKSSLGSPGVPHPEKRLEYVTGKLVSGGAEQLYRYDSVENVVQCVSCASPYDPEPLLAAEGEADQSGDNSVDGVPQFRIASDDGSHVFFETAAALVPQDINGEVAVDDSEGSPSVDVYEWRKPGVSGCARIQGCIALISGGREGLRSKFLGTTPSGRDVFFATHEALVAQDTDSAGDIYDAREGGGEPPPASRAVECEGDACATPFAPPSEITPSRLHVSGCRRRAGRNCG